MKHRLTLLETKHEQGPLRTEYLTGSCPVMPEVGLSFFMYGDSLDPEKDVRIIRTSEVQHIVAEDGCVTFRTLNSTYRLEPVEE